MPDRLPSTGSSISSCAIIQCPLSLREPFFTLFSGWMYAGVLSFLSLLWLVGMQADAKEKARTSFLGVSSFSKYVSFKKVLPFEFVYPSTKPSELPELDRVVMFACRNEFEPATFAVQSRRDFSNVTVEVSDLKTREGALLPKESVEVYVVKVWEQVLGRTIFRNASEEDIPKLFEEYRTPVPELLVTDDSSEPRERWEIKTDADGKTRYTYFPPSFPAKVKTVLKGNEIKQFWLVIHVPEAQQGGIYEGMLLVKSNGKVIASLPLELVVMPVSLQSSEKITGVYLRSTLDRDGYFFVPEDRYRAELRFLKALGIETLTFYDQTYDAVEKALEIAKEIGFKGPIVQMQVPEDKDETRKRVELAKRFGYEPFFYGEDEPGFKTMGRHIVLAERTRSAGGKIVTAIARSMIRFLESYLDWVNISQIYMPIEDPLERFNGEFEFSHEKKVSGVPQIYTHYWQCWQENPLLNRVLAGFYLYRSNLDGFLCYCTYAFQVGLPFHSDLRAYEGRKGQVLKVLNLFYPSKNGVVPTMQSEGLREGIDDLRYIQTAKKLIENADLSGRINMVGELNAVLEPFSYRAVRDGRLRPEDFYKARLNLVRLMAEVASEVPRDVKDRVHDFVRQEATIKTLTHLPPYGSIIVSRGNGFLVEDVAISPNQKKEAQKAPQVVLDKKSVLLVRFDLPALPEGARVAKAVLSLFVLPSSGKGSIVASVHQVLSEWHEDEATWVMRTKSSPWNTNGGDYSPEPLSLVTVTEEPYKEYEWDVTSAVKNWIEKGAKNYGLAIVVREGQGNRVFVSANTDKFQFFDERPSLRIIYRDKSGKRIPLWEGVRGNLHHR